MDKVTLPDDFASTVSGTWQITSDTYHFLGCILLLNCRVFLYIHYSNYSDQTVRMHWESRICKEVHIYIGKKSDPSFKKHTFILGRKVTHLWEIISVVKQRNRNANTFEGFSNYSVSCMNKTNFIYFLSLTSTHSMEPTSPYSSAPQLQNTMLLLGLQRPVKRSDKNISNDIRVSVGFTF